MLNISYRIVIYNPNRGVGKKRGGITSEFTVRDDIGVGENSRREELFRERKYMGKERLGGAFVVQ